MALFLFFAFRNVNIGHSFDLILRAVPLWVIAFIFVFFFSHFIRAVRWKIMIKSIKPDASLSNLFGTVMIGYGINCAVPRLGEVYRAMFLGKWENLSRTSLLGTIIIERVIDIFTFVVSVLISLPIFRGNLFDEVTWLEPTIFFSFLFLAVLIIILIMIVKLREKLFSGIVNIIGKTSDKGAERLSYIFQMLAEGFSSLKGFTDYLLVFLLTAVMMLLYALSNYVGFFMLHMENMQVVTFGTAWILMTISAFGVAIPTPGGTGSYHIFVIFVLVNLFNFSQEVSAAYALLTHFITYVVFIFSTIMFIFIINKRRTKQGYKSENLFSVFKSNSE